MKIGIFTFQDAENYGAALQAFALKCACEKYVDADVINYYNEYFHRNLVSGNFKTLIKVVLNCVDGKKNTKDFLIFRNST